MTDLYKKVVCDDVVEDPIAVVTRAMCVVEKQKGLSGEQKMEAVLEILQKLVETEGMIPESITPSLKMLLENKETIKSIITTIINASKGLYEINKRFSTFKKLVCGK